MAFTKDEVAAKIASTGAFVPAKRVKLDFGDDGVIVMDGTTNSVSQEDGPADATIAIGWSDFQALSAGELNPMAAFMAGKLKVSGDMGAAMQLQNVLGKLG